jgi:hypothetical protein
VFDLSVEHLERVQTAQSRSDQLPKVRESHSTRLQDRPST